MKVSASKITNVAKANCSLAQNAFLIAVQLQFCRQKCHLRRKILFNESYVFRTLIISQSGSDLIVCFGSTSI